jgi:hypothetical protein
VPGFEGTTTRPDTEEVDLTDAVLHATHGKEALPIHPFIDE